MWKTLSNQHPIRFHHSIATRDDYEKERRQSSRKSKSGGTGSGRPTKRALSDNCNKVRVMESLEKMVEDRRKY
jgi:hypothetical protein